MLLFFRFWTNEMGHTTGLGDTGPVKMDNVKANENPIALELGGEERTKY